VSYVAGSELGPGTTVSGYRVETLIGRGGMGAVYRAEEEGLGRKVALKVIAPELAQDERFRERFLRESRIAASLDHPHVIPIYQAGEDDGLLFLAMRYVEGTDFARVVAEEGALEPRRALELLSQVAEALDAAHEKGLVHRDVKPSNVLIAESAGREHCYLGDFGLTKRTGSLSGVSVAGNIVGTLEYVAPEQITGDPLDERSDVYSLGCVLYECLTGQSPFPRATDVALLWAHVHEEPTPPSKARPELPRELDTVLARALAKEPGRRYRSAGELVAATRSALRLVDAPPPEAVKPARRVLAGVAALALLVVVALAALLLTRNSGGLSSVSPNSVGVIDAASNELVAEVQAGVNPAGIALDQSGAWIANSDDGTISHIDRAERRVVETLPVGDYPSDVAVSGGALWVALTEYRAGRSGSRSPIPYGRAQHTIPADYFVSRLDLYGQETATLVDSEAVEGRVCLAPAATIAVTTTRAWFGCDNVLSRVATGAAPNPLAAPSPVRLSASSVRPDFSDVAVGLGAVWLTNRAANTVTAVDPVSNREVRQIEVGEGPSAVAVGSGSVWVASFDDDTIWRLEMSGSRGPVKIEVIEVGDGPVDLALGDGAVWVVNRLDGTLSRVDPSTNEVVATVATGNEPWRLAVRDAEVWVTVRGPLDLGSVETDRAGS
jgi:YVTN family beta-propeller protein